MGDGEARKGRNGSGERLTDRLAIGVLTSLLHRDLVDEVIAEAGRKEQRIRLLPARVVVYFVLAMCLFFDDGYEEVMRKLVSGLRFLKSWGPGWSVPTTGAITQARQRLGEDPLRLLFDRIAVPMAMPGTRGAWLGSWRMMAIDGVQLEVPGTPSNTGAFGKSSYKAVPAGFPQARVVGLGECGTHAIVAAQIGTLSMGERELAEGLLDRLERDMLLMADRGFYSLELWASALETGADLLWRVSASLDLPVLDILEDGSYRSVLADATARQRYRRQVRSGRPGAVLDGIPVRVIEYEITDRGGSGEIFCLITSVLEPGRASALELAAAYHQRWESYRPSWHSSGGGVRHGGPPTIHLFTLQAAAN
jgi:Insertion element 4 transposase N-terminal/Transposase DDE domain